MPHPASRRPPRAWRRAAAGASPAARVPAGSHAVPAHRRQLRDDLADLVRRAAVDDQHRRRLKEDNVDNDRHLVAGVRLGISETLLGLLVCPIDKGELTIVDSVLQCRTCGRRYPVEEGIPNMMVEGD